MSLEGSTSLMVHFYWGAVFKTAKMKYIIKYLSSSMFKIDRNTFRR